MGISVRSFYMFNIFIIYIIIIIIKNNIVYINGVPGVPHEIQHRVDRYLAGVILRVAIYTGGNGGECDGGELVLHGESH